MKKILIGTHNQGKFKEIAYLISKKYKKISPRTLKIKSPKETGKTFTSNSNLKVKYFSKFVDYPAISDDSGLCIKSLNNKPGIYSARLAKKHGNFSKAMKFILKKIKKKKNRSAIFVCSLSYKHPKKNIISVVGKVKGTIALKILGKNGFGYDSIFIPDGHKVTFGQMRKLKKIKMDHRFIAFKQLKKKIKIL
ncbi:RdgB/HAM1 family non-canonical purine NTP pyrophosphatase [Pelagibacteraceae bacterium]|jgi:XTP/dITP diphosphohydrolase|nr:RdgB/HAM1 family non-canonical purine NTP pyrophosphatase [Pelagibacteraceae bacterium]